MSSRTTSETARYASNIIKRVRCASTIATPATTLPVVKKKRTPKPEHGQQIWVYNHLQKNQVIYSLTKALNNNASLHQLPFNGKKTVPRALRKDLWHPLATISFPPKSGAIGLSCFQKLREYRRRHELEWDNSMFTDKKANFITKNKRGRMICDQKANSVADMAAVLSRLAFIPERTGKDDEGSIGLIGEGTGERIEVKWRDMNDAEFAETWSENVEHGILEMHTNNRDVNKVWGKRKMEMENDFKEVERKIMAEEKRTEALMVAAEEGTLSEAKKVTL